MTPISPEDWDVMARTVWAESRGEPFTGQVAVAHVLKNRLASGRWGGSFDQVCMWPAQFSCWNENDPNRPKAMTVNVTDPTFLRAKGITALVVWGDLPDPTQGATHYFASFIQVPKWSQEMVTTAVIGKHRFLKEVN